MDAENRIEFCSVDDFDYSGMYELLDDSMVEFGEVMKQKILETEKVEVSLLVLSPGAKIKEHKHTEDSEWYYFVESEKVEGCPQGMSHSLENPSKEQYLFVISMKYKCTK